MKFIIIGLDDNREQEFPESVLNLINSSTVFSGGKRHYEIVQTYLPSNHIWIDVCIPLENTFKAYNTYTKVVVFASGDPLFLGLGNTICREFPKANIQIIPYFNSLQILAHKNLLAYHDMHVVSLTGRPWDKFDEALIMGFEKIGILTDRKTHTPHSIAQRMIDYGYDNYRIIVGELLGNKDREHIQTYELNEIKDRSFEYPNNIILLRKSVKERPFGIPNREFNLLNGRDKMITKMPIRLLSLHEMELREKTTMWDIGFCTGSISIEAKLQFPHLKVISFEVREEGAALMESNSKKMGTPGIKYYIGNFLSLDISQEPKPEAIFIGGHGGELNKIMTKCYSFLKPNGCIVFNSVSEKSLNEFKNTAKKLLMNITSETTVQIEQYNPITVIKATKIEL